MTNKHLTPPPRIPKLPDSPLNFDVREEEEMLKNEVLHSVATALASIVLPVPRQHISIKANHGIKGVL